MEDTQAQLARFRNDLEAVSLDNLKSDLARQRVLFAREYAEKAMADLGRALYHLDKMEEKIHVRCKSNGRAK